MEKYNSLIADNGNVTLIHISQDSSEDAAEKWAAAESFPWLSILPGDVKRSDLQSYRTRNVVPFYTMVDGNGKEIASGSSSIFSKLASMEKSKE